MCCFLVVVLFRGLVTVLGVEESASGSGIYDKDVVLAVQDEQFSLNVRMHNCFIVKFKASLI